MSTAIEARPSPRASRRGGRRADILRAAREAFARQSYEDASIIEIARRAGVAEGTIYKHFVNKRDLLFQVMRVFYEALIEGTRDGLGGIAGTENRLRFVIWRQLKAFVEDRGLCRVFIREIRTVDDYHASVVHEMNRRYTGIAREIIEDGMERGELRGDLDPRMLRDMIYGGIEHIAWRTVSGLGDLDVEREADELTDVVLRGIRTPPAAGAGAEDEDALDRLQALVERLERGLEVHGPRDSA